MKISVIHSTAYAYEMGVRLSPHIIRLRPRTDGSLHLLNFELQIEPTPSVVSPCFDVEGNTVTQVWFNGETDRLTITSRFEVETLRGNPFDYLLDFQAQSLPMRYPDDLHGGLAAYCLRTQTDDEVAKFAHEISEEASWCTQDFLDLLNRRIHETCPHVLRETGAPQAAEFTLKHRRGSCRDVAVLFMAACRTVGLATRFVSGYQRFGRNPEQRYMHAWAEVFLPGGGWRGYDPTHGKLVSDLHVPVAACRVPSGAAPIQGAYIGTRVSSTMEARVQIGESLV